MKSTTNTISRRWSLGQSTLAAPRPMARDRAKWVAPTCLLAGCALVTAPLFYLSLFRVIATDHDLHLRLIQRGVESGNWPVHFLFPVMVYALSGFSHQFAPLAYAALVVLTVGVMAKAWLSYSLLLSHCGRPLATTDANIPTLSQQRVSPVALAGLLTAALMVSAPIVRPWWPNRVYLGQISPNVWHNPTSIVCWPLVILLFASAAEFLRSGRLRLLLAVSSLAAVSVLAKPNYFLAFAPVFGLLSLKRFGLSRASVLSQLAMLPTVLVLLWQVTASFDGPDAMRPGLHIAWRPLEAWQMYSSSIVVSLTFSLAFPLSYLLVFRRSLVNRNLLVFAWGVLVCALLWAAGFAEVRNADGGVDPDFNFSWGAHLSLYVLFLVTALDMAENPTALAAFGRHPIGRTIERLPWWLLGAHAVSGTFWIVRQFLGRSYR